jgi:transcriptional regulator with XRE-family HTH domain
MEYIKKSYIKATDRELAELIGESRQQFTRWRTQQRSPSFDKAMIIEDKLKLPFECFTSREPNLEAIKDKLKVQLKNIETLIQENNS